MIFCCIKGNEIPYNINYLVTKSSFVSLKEMKFPCTLPILDKPIHNVSEDDNLTKKTLQQAVGWILGTFKMIESLTNLL